MSQPEYRPGLADVPAAESAVSFIDGQRARLEYRGIAAETLARASCYEETAWLLLKGKLPTQKQLAEFDQELRQRRALNFRLTDLVAGLPPSAHPMDALQTGVAALGTFYQARDLKDSGWDISYRLIAGLPTLVAAFARARRGERPLEPRADLDHAANFYYLLFGREPSPAQRKVLDACLILHAEHTMNASTFTARVTGSTLAPLPAVIAAAIGSLAGPLHGGANEEALEMLEAIPAGTAKSWLDAKLKADPKFKLMGFGHRVYKVKDPRATVLQELGEHLFSETQKPAAYDTAQELEKAAIPIFGAKGVFPNVDFYSGIIYQALGIPTDLFTPIFAVARVAGWLAHWHEQMQGNRIFRPEQVFVGQRDVAYVPLEQRP